MVTTCTWGYRLPVEKSLCRPWPRAYSVPTKLRRAVTIARVIVIPRGGFDPANPNGSFDFYDDSRFVSVAPHDETRKSRIVNVVATRGDRPEDASTIPRRENARQLPRRFFSVFQGRTDSLKRSFFVASLIDVASHRRDTGYRMDETTERSRALIAAIATI